MKITIPIPSSMTNGKSYAIEFDSEYIRYINLHRYSTDDGIGGKVPTGATELKFEFDRAEHGPVWVEYDGE